LLVAPLGVAWLFALNGISFVLFAAALLLAPRSSTGTRAQARVVSWASFEAGLHYVRHAPAVRRILLRLVLFAVPANVLWALLAPLAGQRLGLGATGYGVLLGAAGGGAVLGAVLMPRARRRWTPSRLLTLAGAVFGLGLVGLAVARTPWEAVLVLVPVGVAWISVIAGLNATTQAFLPDWVRARALAVYQMVLFASFAGSAAVWGVVANRLGIGGTFLLAGGLLLATTLLGIWLPLRRTDLGDRTAVPFGMLPDVTFLGTPIPDDPVEIVVRYRVSPERLEAFLRVAGDLRTSRLRTGATDWVLLRDAVHPDQLVERYAVASWAEHRDQHERRSTPFDSDVVSRAAALSEGGTAVQHLLVLPVPRSAHHLPRPRRPTSPPRINPATTDPSARKEPHEPADALR
ncbi:MAG: MFS transporter, partial [Janthinobacterium lividum]